VGGNASISASQYAELQVTSNFSFLRGASHPHELVAEAKAIGHGAIAIADRNTLGGVVRAHAAAKELGFRLVIGCRLDLLDAPSLLCFPTDRAAYGRLARLLTLGKRRAEKGGCRLAYGDVVAHGAGQVVVAVAPEDAPDFADFLKRVAGDFPDAAYLAAQHLYGGDDGRRVHRLAALAERARLPLLATNDVLYHRRERRALQDVMTCIREGCTIAEAGLRLNAHAERHLKPAAEMARLFASYPDAVARSLEIVERCCFSLDELRYEYPDEAGNDGTPAQPRLERLTWEGARRRYPQGVPEKIRKQAETELRLIGELGYASYFLTVQDIVAFARGEGILCQGRGSAANSTVCYCLGVTAVDPEQVDLLFERFVSTERKEPPDIDVDFEHERREEVIQYIYRKYTRDRAGLTAVVSSYRSRGAIREVGKALGLSEDVTAALAGTVWGWSDDDVHEEQVKSVGLDLADPTLRRALELAGELIGFPRHLSQHVGGFVITRGRLDELVPIENAAMEERTVIEWDKDDLNVLGILKVDVLGLGMLSCLRRGFALLKQHKGEDLSLATIPKERPEVYKMLGHADSIGVFQVESRAQMSMLPRLQPKNLFDLVVEVAIVRPGPIQGNMVHPYLRRRTGQDPDTCPPALEEVLKPTHGVPLFQEQAMRIAMIAAGFSAVEADGLRRAMATFRRNGDIHRFEEKFIKGMLDNNYERDFAERCFQQIKGFSDYGFPLSHAASFALLVYASAWMKCFHPEVFAAALLNSQPMGFYAPAQILRDAETHGVVLQPVDVNHSDWDCTLARREASSRAGDSGCSCNRESPHRGCECTEPHCSNSLPLSPTAWGRGQGEGVSQPTRSQPAHVETPLTLPSPPARAGGEGEIGGKARVGARPTHALRLGSRLVKGLAKEEAEKISEKRGSGYRSVAELQYRAKLHRGALERLAEADALQSLGLDRRRALWAVKGLRDEQDLPLFTPLAGIAVKERAAVLPPMGLGEEVVEDYAALGLSLKCHPVALLRDALDARRILRNGRLEVTPAEKRVRVAGLVLVRQQPGTASGIIFMTLEDETGIANIVVWRRVFERYRRVVMGAKLVECQGRVQREGEVIHVVAERLIDLSPLLRQLWDPEARERPPLRLHSRDFR
jgi:error-prone DNA polymerase